MKALNVAKYVLNKCTTDGHPISNLQLQKILYYIQHDFLMNYDEALFDDEFEAWKFGPAIPEVYFAYCAAGGMRIPETYDVKLDLSDDKISRIDAMVEEKRECNAWELVNDTHTTGKAWDSVFRKGEGFRDIIPKELIKEKAF